MAAIRCAQCTNELLDSRPGKSDTLKVSLFCCFSKHMMTLQALCLRGGQLEMATEARTLRALVRSYIKKANAVFGKNILYFFAQRQ